MKVSYIFPVSATTVGMIFLLAVAVTLSYLFYKAIEQKSVDSANDHSKHEFENGRSEALIRNYHPIPGEVTNRLTSRFFDPDTQLASARLPGRFGFSICNNLSDPHQYLFFFIDYSTIGSVCAIAEVRGVYGKKFQLQITPESAMFMTGAVRFYGVPNGLVSFVSEEPFELHTESGVVSPTRSELSEMSEFGSILNTLNSNLKNQLLIKS
jgi:hypothetical protein